MLTVQPPRSASRFYHLPSVTNTNLPVHLSEGRPCVQCQRYVSVCLFPTFVSCAVIMPHIIMCFYSASAQNVTLPADC